MSDETLRRLERRWRESGEASAGGDYLRARLRAGELTERDLGLAAYCGHPAARAALGERAPRWVPDLRQRVLGLATWRKGTCVRLAVAVGRRALREWEVLCPGDDRLGEALEIAEAWLETPVRGPVPLEPSARARRVAEQLGAQQRRLEEGGERERLRRARLIAGALACAGKAAAPPRAAAAAEQAWQTLHNACLALAEPEREELERAVFAAVAEWALSEDIRRHMPDWLSPALPGGKD